MGYSDIFTNKLRIMKTNYQSMSYNLTKYIIRLISKEFLEVTQKEYELSYF